MPPPEVSAVDLERLLAAHEQAVRSQLEDGLQVLYRGAVKLMRQVAAEAWSAGGPGADERLRGRIIAALARDDALRALMTQADERHQALRVRVERIERAVRHLIRANRAALESAGGGGELVRRVEALAAEVSDAGVRQREELAAFTRRAAEGLAQASRRIADEMARRLQPGDGAAPGVVEAAVDRAQRSARQHADRALAEGRIREERTEHRLEGLRGSIEALARAMESAPTGTRTPEPGSAQRLRTLQRRLSRISGELAALGGPAAGA